MGFESFRIELRGGPAKAWDVDEKLQALPHIRPDRDSILTPGSTCYRIDDGRHVIEIELLDAPVRLSCRFALCHPTTVDAALLDLARRLMEVLKMKVRICEDVPSEHAHCYSLAQYAEFAAATSQAIDAKRKEWAAAFGPEQMAATTAGAFERFILPHCQQGV